MWQLLTMMVIEEVMPTLDAKKTYQTVSLKVKNKKQLLSVLLHCMLVVQVEVASANIVLCMTSPVCC